MKPITDKELRSALSEAEFSYAMSRDMAKANPTCAHLKHGARTDLAKVLAVKRWIQDRKAAPTKETT